MADSDKNILISPSRGLASQPSIVFTGRGNDPISLRVLDGTTGALSFEGGAGQLFSITDNLTSGSIFSVNDVSGLPSIDVNASGTVSIGTFGGNVGIGVANPQYKLDINGDINFTGTFRQNGVEYTTAGSGWTLGAGDSLYRLNGNVGIGVTAPTQRLDVRGNTLIGAQVTGATATPPYLSLGQNYTNTSLRANCKIRLYDSGGGDVYGFGIGPAGDIQYHSVTTHQFYNSDVATLTINASGTTTNKEYYSSQTNSNQGYGGQYLVNAPFYNTFSQSGSQYQAIVKGRSTGTANTVLISFGSLHNVDNTHEIVFHRIKSDGTDSRQYTLSGNTGKLWHSGNHGSGSTLDADYLDSQDGSYYLNTTTAQSKTGQLWATYGNNAIGGYSWVGAAFTTNSIEIVNDANVVTTSSPTLAFHRYGSGGPQFRLDASGTNILYLESANAGSARSPATQGTTYFASLRLNCSDGNGIYVNGNRVFHEANVGSTSGDRWSKVPNIGGDGVMKIGRYIDFHSTAGDTTDYTYRIDNSSNGVLACSGSLSATTLTSTVATGTAPFTVSSTTQVNNLTAQYATSSPLLSGLGSYVWSASTLPASYSDGIQCSFVQAANGWQNYGSVLTMRTYSGGGGSLQLYVPYSPTYGGNGMQVRFGNYDVSSGNSWTAWKTVWDSGNDGSGSGLNADLLDDLHSASFLRSDTTTEWVGSAGGTFRVTLPAGALGSTGTSVNTLQLYQGTVNTDAFLTFHIGGDYAAHFGLDGTTNDLFYGGWSVGAVKHRVWHAGNGGSGTGLDADLWDGYQLSTRTNWSTNSAGNIVVGQLSWKNYGNNHTIFDASQSTSPDGTAVNNTNSQAAWTSTYPTLMGWNGTNTYGVRVDSARLADYVSTVNVTTQIRTTDAVVINSSSPTLYFQDTDENSAQIHVNSNIFYVLRAGVNSGSWTQIDGVWPLEINLTNNDASFGRSIQSLAYPNVARIIAPWRTDPAIPLASSYNYVLRADNDTGTKLVVFINSSTRSSDNGANSVTIRNDGGALNLGVSGQDLNLRGTVNAVEGISFSNSPNTAGMTSELLTDYEEGTFTPTVVGSIIPGTGTYSFREGRYTKIGNRVLFNISLNWTGHTGTGYIYITGLPFTASAGGAHHSVSVFINGFAMPANVVLQAYVPTSTSQIYPYYYESSTGIANTINFPASGILGITGTYTS